MIFLTEASTPVRVRDWRLIMKQLPMVYCEQVTLWLMMILTYCLLKWRGKQWQRLYRTVVVICRHRHNCSEDRVTYARMFSVLHVWGYFTTVERWFTCKHQERVLHYCRKSVHFSYNTWLCRLPQYLCIANSLTESDDWWRQSDSPESN